MTSHSELAPVRANTGLDETRRLLYMALLRPRTDRYELAGTLVNALAHHHPDGTSAEKIADHLIGVIEDGNETDRAWLLGQIQRLSDAEARYGEAGRRPRRRTARHAYGLGPAGTSSFGQE